MKKDNATVINLYIGTHLIDRFSCRHYEPYSQVAKECKRVITLPEEKHRVKEPCSFFRDEIFDEAKPIMLACGFWGLHCFVEKIKRS